MKEPITYGDISQRTAGYAAADMLRSVDHYFAGMKFRIKLPWWKEALCRLGLMRRPVSVPIRFFPGTAHRLVHDEETNTLRFRPPTFGQSYPESIRDRQAETNQAWRDHIDAICPPLEQETPTMKTKIDSAKCFQFKRQRRESWPEWMREPGESLVGAMMIPGQEADGPVQLSVHANRLGPGHPCRVGDWVIDTPEGLVTVNAAAFDTLFELEEARAFTGPIDG
jgi:hypothetical protein